MSTRRMKGLAVCPAVISQCVELSGLRSSKKGRVMSKNSETFTQRVRRNSTSHPSEEWTFNRELQRKKKLEVLLKTAAAWNLAARLGRAAEDYRYCAQLPVTLLHRVACSD
jgi:predicted component of type VI protein secretion system